MLHRRFRTFEIRRRFAFERADGDETVEVAAATVLTAKLAKDAITLLLAVDRITLDVAAGFAGNDQFCVFNAVHECRLFSRASLGLIRKTLGLYWNLVRIASKKMLARQRGFLYIGRR